MSTFKKNWQYKTLIKHSIALFFCWSLYAFAIFISLPQSFLGGRIRGTSNLFLSFPLDCFEYVARLLCSPALFGATSVVLPARFHFIILRTLSKMRIIVTILSKLLYLVQKAWSKSYFWVSSTSCGSLCTIAGKMKANTSCPCSSLTLIMGIRFSKTFKATDVAQKWIVKGRKYSFPELWAKHLCLQPSLSWCRGTLILPPAPAVLKHS